MSLINDALKRAKEVQKDVAPVAGPEPEFRPVNPEEEDSLPRNFIPPLIIAVLAIAALVLVWRSFHGGDGTRAQTETVVSARSPEVSTPAPEPPVPTVDPELVAAAAQTAPPVRSSAVVSTAKPIEAQVATVPEAPAQPKLQAVVYVPKRPSAIIDGRTVFMGDAVGTYKVSTITRTNVTLACGKERLILNLH